MRKLNTILSVLLLFICLLHGLMGSFMLLGISSGAGKFLAWIGVGILAAHTVLGLLLTAQTFRASRSGGKLYGKQNALFWARRTSGLAILLMLFFHIGVFGRVQDGVSMLKWQALASYFMFVSFLPYGTFTVVTFVIRSFF